MPKPQMQARKAGRPKTLTDPKRLSISIEGATYDRISRFVGWRRFKEGTPVSVSQALVEGILDSRLFRDWEKEN